MAEENRSNSLKAVNIDDDTSVESASDDGHHHIEAHSNDRKSSGSRRFGTIILLAWLAAVTGLALGLGLGLTIDKTKKSSYLRPTNNHQVEQNEESQTETNIAPTNVLVENENPPEPEGGRPYQQQPQHLPPSFTGVATEERTQWPELVGMPCDVAKESLDDLYDRYYEIQVVFPDDQVTKDFQFNRIRLFVDENCEVITIPSIGR